MIDELSSASVQSSNAYNLSVRAGEIASRAYEDVNTFNDALSDLSDEISRLASSFNASLTRIQNLATAAMSQDQNMNELRANATAEANFCIQQVMENNEGSFRKI